MLFFRVLQEVVELRSRHWKERNETQGVQTLAQIREKVRFPFPSSLPLALSTRLLSSLSILELTTLPSLSSSSFSGRPRRSTIRSGLDEPILLPTTRRRLFPRWISTRSTANRLRSSPAAARWRRMEHRLRRSSSKPRKGRRSRSLRKDREANSFWTSDLRSFDRLRTKQGSQVDRNSSHVSSQLQLQHVLASQPGWIVRSRCFIACFERACSSEEEVGVEA